MRDAPNEHPQVVMKELGISYHHATPQSIAEQWWFWNCEGYPETLPQFLTVLNIEPKKAIGLGLSEEKAAQLTNDSKSYEK